MAYTVSGVRCNFGRSNQETEFVLPGCKSVCTASLVDSMGGFICVMGLNKKPFITFQKGRLLCYRNSVQGQLKDLGTVTYSNIRICSSGGKARVSGDHCLQTTISMVPVALQVSTCPSPWGYFSGCLCSGIFSDPAGIEKHSPGQPMIPFRICSLGNC